MSTMRAIYSARFTSHHLLNHAGHPWQTYDYAEEEEDGAGKQCISE